MAETLWSDVKIICSRISNQEEYCIKIVEFLTVRLIMITRVPNQTEGVVCQFVRVEQEYA